MGSGQFFVSFVIHLQTKLELFILQRNAVLFLTARFFWQVIAHTLARCEIKIQLFLKFRWHDPIGLWYIISHFYYSNWEGFQGEQLWRGGEGYFPPWPWWKVEGHRGMGWGQELNNFFVIWKMSSIVILLCHSHRRLMGQKSQYFTFDQIKLHVGKVEIIGVWKNSSPRIWDSCCNSKGGKVYNQSQSNVFDTR